MDESIDIPEIAVVDASFLLSFFLPDEENNTSSVVMDAYAKDAIRLLSSPLLPFEVSNGLYMAVRRKRILPEHAGIMVEKMLAYDIEFLPIQFSKVLQLATEKKTTIYDASYLWIAITKNLPLLTLDKTLSRLAS